MDKAFKQIGGLLDRALARMPRPGAAIEWDVVEKVDCHGYGFWAVALEGVDQYGNKYTADGYTLNGDIQDEIENIEKL